MSEDIDEDGAKFPLWLEEKCIADELVFCVRELLRRRGLTPVQIRDIAALLLALEALPLPVKGLDIYLTLIFYRDDGTIHQSIHLSDEVFTLGAGGYSKSEYGGDSYGDNVLDMEIGGYRSEEAPAWVAVSEWIDQFKVSSLAPDHELEISNEGNLSELDWEMEPDESVWATVKSFENDA